MLIWNLFMVKYGSDGKFQGGQYHEYHILIYGQNKISAELDKFMTFIYM